MEEPCNIANYYAVEALSSVFGKESPTEQEIMDLESKLGQKSYRHYAYLYRRKNVPRVLIITPEVVEQNILTLMLKTQGFKVDRAETKEELWKYFTIRKRYDLVIISDRFTEIGYRFFWYYFDSTLRHQQTFLVHFGEEDRAYKAYGFDAHLNRLFFLDDLVKLLPEHLRKRKKSSLE